MFDIYYKGQVVASADTFAQAKTEANIYRRKNFITQWRDVTFKQRRHASVYMQCSAEDDGCCDGLRDRRREIYGCGQ
jgi:hypothetical protein